MLAAGFDSNGHSRPGSERPRQPSPYNPAVKVFRRLPPPDQRQPCALTIGNFDGVHRGHQALVSGLVADARSHGLIGCVLTFEPHPREFFAVSTPEPVRIANLRDKLEALAALDVDRVCVAHFNQSLAATSAQEFIAGILVQGLHTRRLLIGDDFRFGARRAGDFALLEQMGPGLGMQVRAMPTVVEQGSRISSSLVRQALADADLDRVRHLLGRPYRLSGRVIHGRRLGRELGFPTLNLRFPHGRPALRGIFVVQVHGIADDGQVLPGVASIGTRPAVETGGAYLLEVHLLDWSGDAYGKLARVEFLRKIRDEQHFPSLDALRSKIGEDTHAAREFFEACR
ncbi:MAG: bifunctional riboflavin kinase/FAD synthetase [Lautropia sp.]|nr:bifunctional riboflavin kinase/FAD synthetase [Lautropia sp.]